jgi:NAD-dependent deacetylase
MQAARSLSPATADRIRQAGSILFLTGAGMSADSGLPTFRDKSSGLWERFSPRELATPAAFKNDPTLVWNWYEWRRLQVLQALPHAGHRVIAALARARGGVSVVTQNVDDLHERGGVEALHLHGSLFAPRCCNCARPYKEPAATDIQLASSALIQPPHCAHCGGWVRPGVVWFGEALPQDAWRRTVALAQGAELLVVVGTSAVVEPAARIPGIAKKRGAVVVEINTDPVLAADWTIDEAAVEGLQRLLDVVGVGRGKGA